MSQTSPLETLVIFRSLLKDSVIGKFSALLLDDRADEHTFIRKYAEFCAELFSNTDNLTKYFLEKILEDDNFYVRLIAEKKFVPENISQALIHELKTLEEVSRITSASVREKSDLKIFLPDWNTSKINFSEIFSTRMENISRIGYGIYASHTMFTIQNESITPLRYADPQKLSGLYGYERERGLVIQNTLSLLAGKPSQNVLLYGDAGTGKSSTVKAIANEFAKDGLRLIEVKKSDMHLIPKITEELAGNPLKFILFIDDLSFSETDLEFSVLKAILEGSAAFKTKNIAVYATSNRRHLVRESFSARNGDEVHLSDTLEETASLASRFGLVVTFLKPDKASYLRIVESLANEYQLDLPEDELFSIAESFALRSGGRTPRTAKQFVEMMVGEPDAT